MNPNIIEIDHDSQTVNVTMTRQNGDQHTMLVDLCVWPLISRYHFRPHAVRSGSNKFYAVTNINGKQTFAHSLILEGYLSPEFPECDHLQPECTLDNRLGNLRTATRSENMLNTTRSKGPKPEARPAVHCLSVTDSNGLTIAQRAILKAVVQATSKAVEMTKDEAIYLLDLISQTFGEGVLK